jgi:hypothetical protein
MKKFLLYVFVCLTGGMLTFVLYQQFWAKRVAAQSTNTTRIYIPWIGGADAGYTSLLEITNTSMDPYGTTAAGGTCTADFYYNGTHYGPGTLPNQAGSAGNIFAPGVLNVLDIAQIQTATGVALANSGQRGYMFLTCNFPYAHAQALMVNPGGVITFIPGYVVPPNRSFSTGPEQLLQ